ncbi:MAG: aldo/keto reductase [Parcubacteria group bacterium]|nr:aldo/keto reductase [Parcubacteria group bacterium]
MGKEMNIPALGMGTWGMGGKYERDESNIEQSISILKQGLALGIRLIDTAELYGEGLTEEIVGQAIKGHNREDIFLITKVWKTNLRHDAVLAAAEKSLKRLQTDYIDLYLIHWPNEAAPLLETMRALEELVSNKKVRHIGVSNFSVPIMEEAQSYLSKTTLAANQIEYSLLERSAEKEIIPFCKENNIKVIAHRPLAKGKLALEQKEILNTLSKKYQKTPIQIALNWLISQDIVVIPKTANAGHLKEICGAVGWRLEETDTGLLKSDFV